MPNTLAANFLQPMRLLECTTVENQLKDKKMKNELKIFLFNIAIILLCAVTLLFTSLLLDWRFIDAYFARQMVVYTLMLVQAFVYVRIFLIYNKVRL